MSVSPVGDLSSLGAALHIGGSLLIVLGQTVVKIAHCIKGSSGLSPSWLGPSHLTPRAQWQRPDGQWRRLRLGSKSYTLLGWTLFGVGNALRFVSMRFASQTVLSGLGSLQFVLIPLVSQALLGIRPDRSTALGVATVVLGNILIVYYGPGDRAYSVPELRLLWQTRTMQAFLVAMAATLLVLQLVWWELRAAAKAQRLTAPFSMLPERRAVARDDGADPADAGLAPAESLGFALPWTGTWVTADAAQVFTGALLYSAVASVVGAWSVLFSKSLTYVVSALPEVATDPYAWFVLVAFLGTAAFWIRQSNQGLRLYPASLIMPLMQAFWMCMSVLEGGIYFQELSNLQRGPRCLLVLGLAMALVGAIFMGVAGFVVERRLAAAAPAAGAKDSFSLVPGAALEAGARPAPEAEASEGLGGGAARSLARVDSSGTVSPRRRAAALSNLRPMSVSVLPHRRHTIDSVVRPVPDFYEQQRLLSQRDGALSPPTSPSSIADVVLDSQRLLRAGAGGLLHRVTQAFN